MTTQFPTDHEGRKVAMVVPLEVVIVPVNHDVSDQRVSLAAQSRPRIRVLADARESKSNNAAYQD
ncbi:MAG TPA: hypothetical protein P5186_24930 [Candidatus Paceibacterota bacterium]|nr:hypothetical protein [Verrucomicrobiota bacterium]HRY51308.1 hypothetical protein [Candidatus Paceibacterota bacterium]HSA00182.1 hypothetical protein [Candidatus Paceibacterota bacterium]